jgi:hypothetical protein
MPKILYNSHKELAFREKTPYAKINQQIINQWMRFQPDSQNPILPIEFFGSSGFFIA